jgi:arylsulfatase A-like enzyme
MVIERALDWLRQDHDRPVFLFVHFFDSHWPYEPPEDFGVNVDNAYEGEVAYMDHYLGKLLEVVPDLGLAPENTLTVLFSDHGEDLAGWYPDDHAGVRGHPEENGHGALLFDVTQLVPLIICDAGAPSSARTVTSQVRLIDVMPTILDLLDLDNGAVEGTSLRSLLEDIDLPDRPAYCEAFYREELAAIDPEWAHLTPLQGVRLGASKIIWEFGGDGVYHYDLTTDPAERTPQTLSRNWIIEGQLGASQTG